MSKHNITSKLPQNIKYMFQYLADLLLQLLVRVQVEVQAKLTELDAMYQPKIQEVKYKYMIHRNKIMYMFQSKLSELKNFQRKPKTTISHTTHYITVTGSDQTPHMITIQHITIQHTEKRTY